MELEKYIAFMEETEKLKSVVRTAWSGTGRRESTPEHSWRLALFAAILADSYPQLNAEKLLLMSLVHDIGEIYEGDISAALYPDKEDKYRTELQAVQKVFGLLPKEQGEKLFAVWKEYNDGLTGEAKLIKALDKAETILQHNQGKNPADFDYQFNLEYGAEYFQEDGLLQELRAILDEGTRRRSKQKEEPI